MFQVRGDNMHAFSFISDESPPGKPRYCGHRFQITFINKLMYEPLD